MYCSILLNYISLLLPGLLMYFKKLTHFWKWSCTHLKKQHPDTFLSYIYPIKTDIFKFYIIIMIIIVKPTILKKGAVKRRIVFKKKKKQSSQWLSTSSTMVSFWNGRHCIMVLLLPPPWPVPVGVGRRGEIEALSLIMRITCNLTYQILFYGNLFSQWQWPPFRSC